MDWQVAILILGIVGSFVGIAAGVVQVVDYAEKRRETRKQAQDGASMTAAPAEPARPARPEEATPKAPTNNLPAPATPLVGREKEVASITRLIAREPVRLVTLTGLGGIGKTRIAIQAASDLLPVFPSGAYFVDLEPIN